jgi:hypothetical protein
MFSQVMHNGVSMDFADVLLVINVFAIAMLLGILYIDEIARGCKRVLRALNPHGMLGRLRFWVNAHRAHH